MCWLWVSSVNFGVGCWAASEFCISAHPLGDDKSIPFHLFLIAPYGHMSNVSQDHLVPNTQIGIQKGKWLADSGPSKSPSQPDRGKDWSSWQRNQKRSTTLVVLNFYFSVSYSSENPKGFSWSQLLIPLSLSCLSASLCACLLVCVCANSEVHKWD